MLLVVSGSETPGAVKRFASIESEMSYVAGLKDKDFLLDLLHRLRLIDELMIPIPTTTP